jgi:NAD(P)-dependent dehydrogenase (short-subunit alcohol dehydrogenase family)
MKDVLANRLTIVVGVGSTIGRATALRSAREGAEILAIDPDAAAALEVAAVAVESGATAHALAADVATEQGAEAVRSWCADRWSRVDSLLMCSSALDTWPLDEDTLDRWREVFEVNLWGPIAYTRALLPMLLSSDGGSIVYLSSIDGLRGNTNLCAFSISKGGVVSLTQLMADKYGPRGLRVNCVASAGITQLRNDVVPSREMANSDLVKLTPMRRLPVADEIAAAIVFLASDDASYITGTVLRVDGGRLAATPGTYLDADAVPLDAGRWAVPPRRVTALG